MSVVIAVDSGGTFTDCVIVDQDGAISRAKAPSTPPRFEEGVIDAVAEASQRLGRRVGELLADTEIFVHGTTVATNILITRTGAKTALLTTRGHEDAILIGRTVQKVAGLSEAEIINVARLSKADPLVPRQRIVGIDERVDRDGEIVVPLDTSRLGDVVDGLRAAGVQSIAISFLWSFLNPEHERRVKEALVAAAGGDSGNGATGEAGDARWFVTASSDLAPVMREYERTSTTVLNAYLMPGVHGYLDGMRQRLRDGGHRGAIAVMHSGG
ncbi:MAG: hydantoinase/oxoprolinase N-terminal domain-containing protein, partial [Thermoleophilaceae bacterium]